MMLLVIVAFCMYLVRETVCTPGVLDVTMTRLTVGVTTMDTRCQLTPLTTLTMNQCGMHCARDVTCMSVYVEQHAQSSRCWTCPFAAQAAMLSGGNGNYTVWQVSSNLVVLNHSLPSVTQEVLRKTPGDTYRGHFQCQHTDLSFITTFLDAQSGLTSDVCTDTLCQVPSERYCDNILTHDTNTETYTLLARGSSHFFSEGDTSCKKSDGIWVDNGYKCNSDCYRVVGGRASYTGKKNTTSDGTTCQAWSVQSPHGHDQTSSRFPDDGYDNRNAANYCRDPDGEGVPWCYTVDPSRRWRACGIPLCP